MRENPEVLSQIEYEKCINLAVVLILRQVLLLACVVCVKSPFQYRWCSVGGRKMFAPALLSFVACPCASYMLFLRRIGSRILYYESSSSLHSPTSFYSVEAVVKSDDRYPCDTRSSRSSFRPWSQSTVPFTVDFTLGFTSANEDLQVTSTSAEVRAFRDFHLPNGHYRKFRGCYTQQFS